MAFQAYLDNIQTKTGKEPEELAQFAKEKGLLKPGTKTGQVGAWLKEAIPLGHGMRWPFTTISKTPADCKRTLINP